MNNDNDNDNDNQEDKDEVNATGVNTFLYRTFGAANSCQSGRRMYKRPMWAAPGVSGSDRVVATWETTNNKGTYSVSLHKYIILAHCKE